MLNSTSRGLRSSVFGLRSSVFGLRSSVFGLRSSGVLRLLDGTYLGLLCHTTKSGNKNCIAKLIFSVAWGKSVLRCNFFNCKKSENL